jgi:hypothetical protein
MPKVRSAKQPEGPSDLVATAIFTLFALVLYLLHYYFGA